MVVICTRCATQFQFDESRLPLKGAKVRCSRCTEAFFLAHPKAAMSEFETDSFEEELSGVGELAFESPDEASLEDASETDVEDTGGALEDDLKWDFDFNAQTELHEMSEEVVVPVASVTEDRSSSASRAGSRGGEQAVFASAADLADWLADRTDTLEPEPIPDPPEPAASPPPVQSAPVPLGMMVKKPLGTEPSSRQASHESAVRSPAQNLSIAAREADPSIEVLLANLLGMPQGQVPNWFRSGIRSAVQVLGWGITLTLVTTGLIKGVWLAL